MSRQDMMDDLRAREQRLRTDPQARAAVNDAAVQRRVEAFNVAFPGAVDWMVAAAGRGFGFASDMLRNVHSGKSLSERQIETMQRLIQQDKDRAEQRAADDFRAQEMARPVHAVNLGAVEASFASAKQQGIKWPKLTLDGFMLKPAGEASRNAGSIYVTKGDDRDGLYLGKVMRGQFEPSRECDEATRDKVLEAMADPLASAVAYGKKYGRCAVCQRELSDADSVARGVGPVCAERMGWA